MTSKLSMISSDEDDFGFTFSDGSDLVSDAVAPHIETSEELISRLQLMYNSIIPLLANLKSNPDQDYIKWPDREKKVVAFKNKLDKIGGDYIKAKEKW